MKAKSSTKSRDNKQLTIFITCIVAFTMLFPYTVTSVNLKKSEVKVYEPKLMGKYVVIHGNEDNKIDVEMFIPLVLYSILPEKYEGETFKTMSVIIRTCIMNKMAERTQINADELGLPYTTYSELEKKWGQQYEEKYNAAMKIIKETNGQVITYEGNVIYPYYHEISAGVTNCGEYGYLQSVESKEDENAEGYENIMYFSADNIIEKLQNTINVDLQGKNLAEEIILNMEQNGSYVRSVSVGDNVIAVEDWQKMYEIPSTAFTFESFSDGYKITSKGKGNGKGLSIYGAQERAKQGKKYIEIIKHYYSGVEVVKSIV